MFTFIKSTCGDYYRKMFQNLFKSPPFSWIKNILAFGLEPNLAVTVLWLPQICLCLMWTSSQMLGLVHSAEGRLILNVLVYKLHGTVFFCLLVFIFFVVVLFCFSFLNSALIYQPMSDSPLNSKRDRITHLSV